jgi:simple sugar transport system permease protein
MDGTGEAAAGAAQASTPGPTAGATPAATARPAGGAAQAATARAAAGAGLAARFASPEARLAVIAAAIFALMAALAPDRFLSAQNVTSMAFQFPEFAILALAMTLAMLTGGIDLSVVGVANLSAIVAALILKATGAAGMEGAGALGWLALAYAAALATGMAAGLCNGLAVAAFGLPPILATLGSGLVFTGLAVALTGGSAVMGLPPAAAFLGNGYLLGMPAPLVLFGALAAGLSFVLGRTAFGLRVQMLGANPVAARFAAVDAAGVLIRAYVACGALAAIAGLVVMSRANSAKADYGSSYLLLAVLIAVLGGVNPYGGYGRVIGVVLAVLSMQFLSSGLNMLGVSNFARELIWGLLLIAVMAANAGRLARRGGL